MIRVLPAALALACAFSTSACVTDLTPGTITSGDIAAGANGLPPGQVSNIRTKIAQVQQYARVACNVVPTVEAIVNIFAAMNPVAANVKSVTDIVCSALANAPVYTADMPTRGKARARAADAPPGTPVTGTVVVNGTPVVVTGKVAR